MLLSIKLKHIRCSVLGCTLLFLLAGQPAHAQRWLARLGATLEHDLPSTLHGMTAGQAALSHGLERSARQALAHTTPAIHTTSVAKSILTVREKDWLLRMGFPAGTAFVLEEHYQGKKYLWGVTATHYLYQKPAVKLPRQRRSVRVSFDAQSSAGMGDIALFPLPPQLAEHVTPLQLAPQPPQVGEELFSVGFFNKELQTDEHRTVQEITPARMITTLQVDPEIKREGACGSPVLNQQQEVVGLHIGSSYNRQIGYVVPAEHIRRTLAAYHQAGAAVQPLVYNGVRLGEIDVNESIQTVQWYAQGQLIDSKSTYHQEKRIDYGHLESFADFSGADQIVWVIEQNPFSMQDTDQQYHTFLLSYNLQTGEITRSPGESYRFPRR